MLRLAVDVGGTFTDVYALDAQTGEPRVAKVSSTPGNPIEGVLNGVAELGIDWRDVAFFSHGTTIATNALIMRQLPSAAMVTTRGFRDVIEIRRGTKEDLWDAYRDVAPPYLRRRDRFVVPERTDYAGRVVTSLDEEEARRVAAVLRRREVSTVAICFINAHANPANELRMRTILEEEIPGISVSTSSEILPEIFEHERFSTTVANAVVAPLVGRYVGELQSSLDERGYKGDVLLLHSGGGVMTPKTAARYAVRLAASGLAAGAIAARHIAGLCGHRNALGLDMGGTSTDISMVWDGEARVTKEWSVEYGYPILFPSIEVLTIGAGGGSLAWIDEGGALRNGPQSAGADPGPACYGRGSAEPTNTDANVVLGRLGDSLLGGAMPLDRVAAEQAVAKVGGALGLGSLAAATAIVRIANANMADALRLISIRRGYDPRDFALVVFGGAGPLHGAALAREMSIPTVLVPPNPGITSALGCLLVDVRHDFAAMRLGRADDLDPADIERDFQELEAEARDRLRIEGIPEEGMRLQRTLDMRYVGQWRSLAIPVGSELASLDEAVAAFHAEHEREHNYKRLGAPVEVYRVNVTAVGLTPKADLARYDRGRSIPSPSGERSVMFDENDAPVATPVWLRADLPAGAALEGPAAIDQLDSTVLVPPGVNAEVDEWLNIRMHIPGGQR